HRALPHRIPSLRERRVFRRVCHQNPAGRPVKLAKLAEREGLTPDASMRPKTKGSYPFDVTVGAYRCNAPQPLAQVEWGRLRRGYTVEGGSLGARHWPGNMT